MRWIIVLLAVASCTKRNPDVCCETFAECSAIGWGDQSQPCAAGSCVKKVCVDYGTCDGDEDCASPETCMNGTCMEPMVSPDASVPVQMVEIPAGPFPRGCNGSVETNCNARPEEIPLKILTISKFFIDATEVTSYAYQECVTAGVCPASGWYEDDPINKPLNPIVGIPWKAAHDYCAWRGLRLPTEAEWEKAARGINGFTYPWGNTFPASYLDACKLAWYGSCPGGDQWSLPVASLPMGDSPFNVHDMAGNVFEYIEDFWDPTYYSISPTMDPKGPPTGTEHDPGAGFDHVLRGGGRAPLGRGEYQYLRTSSRSPWPESSMGHMSIGFRCAKN